MNGLHLLAFAAAFAVVFLNFLAEEANRARRATDNPNREEGDSHD